MPAADELFRTTGGNGTLMHNGRGEEEGQRPARERDHNGHNTSAASPVTAPAKKLVPAPPESIEQAVPAPAPQPQPQPQPQPPAPVAEPAARKVTAPRRPSGRERHDEKITVYVSPDELLGLEHARITLRGEYGVAVDRGRIVREAVAALLADFDARGRDSILVKRLSSGG
ncbi:MAG: hypothetical protein JF587_14390 [Catenulisporales bacterium]|nr:hypothetical protein [Catenulisporales bacterium]